MFIPRAVRLKGVREPPRPKKPAKPNAPSKPPAHTPATGSKDGLVEAMQDTSMNSPAPQQDSTEKPVKRGQTTAATVTPEYIAQLAAGIELIFTDYAHQEEERAKWLQQRYRVVEGQERCTSSLQSVFNRS
jgi:hypothetical protein